MNAKSLLLAVFVALSCTHSVSAAATDQLALKFGLYTVEKPSSLIRQFRPILDQVEVGLGRTLGKKVKIKTVIARTYAEGQENLASGQVDFSRMGPASYIAVKQRTPNISVLALESRRGRKVFHGIICVPSDSPVKDLSDLKGKSFAFGNERSTIGRYLPQMLLVKNEVRSKDLAHFAYLGRHDLVGAAVNSKKFDAGALKESTFKALVKKGYKIREVARMDNTTQPWIAAAQVPPNIVKALRQVLLGVRDTKALKALKSGPLLPGTDADYDHIRAAISQNQRFFE